MHVYSNGPSENGIIGLEKGIRLGVKYLQHVGIPTVFTVTERMGMNPVPDQSLRSTSAQADSRRARTSRHDAVWSWSRSHDPRSGPDRVDATPDTDSLITACRLFVC
jgi:hypothetical protein